MRAIQKGPEPTSLTKHRASKGATYGNYRETDDLREALVNEQRGICCYCMQEIKAAGDAMKIEHWACQHTYTRRELDYSNMLGACRGGDNPGKSVAEKDKHCDSRKGSKDLKWNPANPTHAIESRIWYEPDGTIRSQDDEFDQQLNQVLNLNLKDLKNARGGMLTEIARWFREEKARRMGPIPRDIVQRKLTRWQDASPLKPFAGVAIWAFRKRLEAAS